MSRDATLVPNFSRDNLLNYSPAIAQALVDYGFVAVHLKLPIAFGNADASVLFTVPTGLKLNVQKAYWEIGTSFTGGASSAIGVSSDDTDYSTKGDILGGASGDVAATLVSTGRKYKGGTIGAKFGSNGIVTVGSGKILRYDQITSTFTAGAGFVHVDGFLID